MSRLGQRNTRGARITERRQVESGERVVDVRRPVRAPAVQRLKRAGRKNPCIQHHATNTERIREVLGRPEPQPSRETREPLARSLDGEEWVLIELAAMRDEKAVG